MRITRLKLENWRNFTSVDVALQRRVFLIGPNASGKSNFLNAMRFLQIIADPQGGFQRAVAHFGGVSNIRSLYARRYPNIKIEVEIDVDGDEQWSYLLEFSQNNQRIPIVKNEVVMRNGSKVHQKNENTEREDLARLTQTDLEQVSLNKKFRAVAAFFEKIRYLHLVPQLVREPERSAGKKHDPFGGDFLEQLATTDKRTLNSRLMKLQNALKVAIPQLKELRLERDALGVPHLEGRYEHWRPNAGWQREDLFSDGTLRLTGLLWTFLDGTGPLLLEEPELSLHEYVVRRIPSIMARISLSSSRQIIVSTHSMAMLMDESIAPGEAILLKPAKEGTKAISAADIPSIMDSVRSGIPLGEVLQPESAPKNALSLSFFGGD